MGWPAQPTVSSVIAGATKPEQIAQNVLAADWVLDEAELEEVKKITRDQGGDGLADDSNGVSGAA